MELLIDADVHEYLGSGAQLHPYLPAQWHRFEPRLPSVSYARDMTLIGRQEWFLEDGTLGTDLEALQGHLFGEEKVSLAILNGFFHVSAMSSSYEFAQALARAYNDWQVEHWLEQDERLCGSVHVVAHDPAEAAREIDRVAQHPRIVQVFLPTVMDRQYGDPMYRPIYEAALRNGLVIALHHGPETQTALGNPRYYIERHALAAPQANMSQLCSLIFNGTFDTYPELKVVIMETGVAWLPWALWRFDQQYKEMRAEVPWVKRLPSEHIKDSVRLTTQPMGDLTTKQFQAVVELAEADDVYLFSTDYPHFDADTADTVLPPSLPLELRRKIRFENALATYPRLAGIVAGLGVEMATP